MNRQITGRIATYNFSPTLLSEKNLLEEKAQGNIFVTGNTVIDALQMVVEKLKTDDTLRAEQDKVLLDAGYDVTRLAPSAGSGTEGKKLVLITGHRRENFGDGFIRMVTAMKDLSEKYPDVDFVYPMHLNPNVRKPIHVDRSIKDPFTFARTNVMGTLSLLQAAKLYWESLPEKYEGKRFYHISTDEVYGALEMTNPEGIEPPFTTTASSSEHHLAYGKDFFYEDTKYNPHSPYSASKASSDHFVRAFHDTYGMPTIVTNCSNNYGPYQFPEKLIPLFINNIRHRKPLPVYGKGENVRDWLYVVDHEPETL